MRREISSNDAVVDQRDVQEHFEELQSERDALEEGVKDAETALAFAQLNGEEGTPLAEASEAVEEAKRRLTEWDSEYMEEMNELKRIADEVPSDETMINESYWVEYVEELVKDIGDMPKNIPDYVVIDWEATAENVRSDYCEIDYNGTTFYYRSA